MVPNKSFGLIGKSPKGIVSVDTKRELKEVSRAKPEGRDALKASTSRFRKNVHRTSFQKTQDYLKKIGMGKIGEFLQEPPNLWDSLSKKAKRLFNEKVINKSSLTPRLIKRKDFSLKRKAYLKNENGSHFVGNTRYAFEFLHKAERLRILIIGILRFHHDYYIKISDEVRWLILKGLRFLKPDNPSYKGGWFNQLAFFVRKAMVLP